MCEAAGHIKRSAILRGEFEALPLTECRRIAPYVRQNIKDRTSGAADEFDFGLGIGLKVHPANHTALFCEREIALRPMRVESVGGELLLTESPRQKTAFVFAQFQFDEPETVQLGARELHGSDDLHLRDGYDKFTARIAIRFLLGENFIRQKKM